MNKALEVGYVIVMSSLLLTVMLPAMAAQLPQFLLHSPLTPAAFFGSISKITLSGFRVFFILVIMGSCLNHVLADSYNVLMVPVLLALHN